MGDLRESLRSDLLEDEKEEEEEGSRSPRETHRHISERRALDGRLKFCDWFSRRCGRHWEAEMVEFGKKMVAARQLTDAKATRILLL
ncbi:hypothetical protein TIFTF001_002457 [Ficus carica]|uniref:Uncharacterized protein n=1 Tax=Ficus carica TaxID=3494 RepID=A0AA87ZMT3_FICCA|nr:hypothetical protein TIFTF001_002457 [Ficus carica]